MCVVCTVKDLPGSKHERWIRRGASKTEAVNIWPKFSPFPRPSLSLRRMLTYVVSLLSHSYTISVSNSGFRTVGPLSFLHRLCRRWRRAFSPRAISRQQRQCWHFSGLPGKVSGNKLCFILRLTLFLFGRIPAWLRRGNLHYVSERSYTCTYVCLLALSSLHVCAVHVCVCALHIWGGRTNSTHTRRWRPSPDQIRWLRVTTFGRSEERALV